MSDTRPILFATDGSPSAEDARREAFDLAQRLDCRKARGITTANTWAEP